LSSLAIERRIKSARILRTKCKNSRNARKAKRWKILGKLPRPSVGATGQSCARPVTKDHWVCGFRSRHRSRLPPRVVMSAEKRNTSVRRRLNDERYLFSNFAGRLAMKAAMPSF
jgi:hypothetical protein